MAVHFNILHSTTAGLRTAVAVHFNILHSTTAGLRTAVAVHFNILHSTTAGLRTAVAVHFTAYPLTLFFSLIDFGTADRVGSFFK